VLWCPCFAISQFWFGYRYSGKGNVSSTGPVLLVSNHQSHLDPVLIGLACPRQLKYLARVGLFFWPFSWWIRALGAVSIDRESALAGIKTTLKLLKDGEAVVVFPEGSRTPDGKLHPLLPGFCVLARRSGATIVPVAIDGAFHALPRGSHFPRPRRIRLTFGKPITSEQSATFADEQLTELVYQRIRGALQSSSV
jgi:1-acyl-sn-glycerol-3-phosphate acyltransferase